METVDVITEQRSVGCLAYTNGRKVAAEGLRCFTKHLVAILVQTRLKRKRCPATLLIAEAAALAVG